MLHLRKGKKEIVKFETLYDFADQEKLIAEHFGTGNVQRVQRIACQNAFALAISGAKLKMGGGYIIEKC